MSNCQGKKHGTIVMPVLALALVLVAVIQTGAQVDNKIHGGVEVEPGEFPFLATLLLTKNGTTKICGGSIIDEHHILTAAHCILDDYTLVLKLGCHELSRCKNEYKISGHLIHPSYSNKSFKNDIGILRTEKPISETGSISRGSIGFIELPELDDLFADDLLTVAGWGKIGNRMEYKTDVPLKVNVSALDLQDCMINFPGVDYSQICAGSAQMDSCQGDSGGPLFRTNQVNGQRILLGIVSFGGNECGRSPGGVYTRVASFIDWIEESILFSQYW